MFNCRVCSNTPFGSFFGFTDKDDEKKEEDSVSEMSSEYSSEYTSEYSEEDKFSPRSPGQLVEICNTWLGITHQRAKEMWTDEDLRDVFSQVAKGVDKDVDPVRSPDDKCCIWHGTLSPAGYPTVKTKRAPNDNPSDTFVTRALVFSFADDDSFEELRHARGNKPFEMVCGNHLCVNLTHIALD